MPPLVHHALIASVVASGLGALVMCLLVLVYGFGPILDDSSGRGRRQFFLTRLGHAAAGACFAFTAIVALLVLARPWPRPAPAVDVSAPALTRELQAPTRELQSRIAAVDASLGELQKRLGHVESRLGWAEASVREAGDDAAVALTRVRQHEHSVIETRGTIPAEPGRVVAAPSKPAVSVTAPPPVVPPSPAPAPPLSPAADLKRPAPTPPPSAAVAPRPEPLPTASTTRPEGPPSAKPAPAPAVKSASTPAARPAPAPEPGGSHLVNKLRSDWDAVKRAFDAAGDDMRNAVRPRRD